MILTFINRIFINIINFKTLKLIYDNIDKKNLFTTLNLKFNMIYNFLNVKSNISLEIIIIILLKKSNCYFQF